MRWMRKPSNACRRSHGIAPSRSTPTAPPASSKLVFYNHSALHHEFDVLHLGDILERVSGRRDQVRELAFFDGAHFVLPMNDPGVHEGRHAQSIKWRRAPTHKDGKHLALHTMGTVARGIENP